MVFGKLPREKLVEIVSQYGSGVTEDARRCKGLLLDLCGDHQREINALVGALSEQVAVELTVGHRSGVPMQVLLPRLAQRLYDRLGLDRDLANWAVESWALALGILSEDAHVASRIENVEAGARRKKEEAAAAERREWQAKLERAQAEIERLRREKHKEPPVPLVRPPAAPQRTTATPIAGPNQKSAILKLAPGIELALVLVPAGEFLMGSDKRKDKAARDGETPQHKLSLPDYWIGKHPVTVAQFAAFVQASGHICGPRALRDAKQYGNHPVDRVSWCDAKDFCTWASQITGRTVRLPSEAEWEKAARGSDGRLWPWGNEAPDKKRCNFNHNVKDTTPVGQYSPRGDSPYGCVDMAGNVEEWCRSENKPYPYNAEDGREQVICSSAGHVVRGGDWYDEGDHLRCAYRSSRNPFFNNGLIGFRCVL